MNKRRLIPTRGVPHSRQRSRTDCKPEASKAVACAL
jgi:hypothetical protein